MTEHRQTRRADAARYGTLDVPLSVWQVADAASLTAALLTELRPARGPIVTVDVSGWEAITRTARHAVVLTRDRATAETVLATISGPKRGLARIQPVSERTLANRLAAIDARTQLVIASTWMLGSVGALAAAARALRPEGILALIGRGMADQARLAHLARPHAAATDETDSDEEDEWPAALGLVFTGHIAAAAPAAFDAAVARAEARTATGRSCPASARHFDVVLWRKTAGPKAGGTHAAG